MKRFQPTIEGMHCAACSTRIERVVGNLDGVHSCTVNLATGQGNFEYDTAVVSKNEIEESIRNLGFEPIEVEEGGEDSLMRDPENQLTELRRRLLPAFVLSALIMFISMGPMIGLPLPDFLAPDSSPFTHTLVQFLLVLPVLYLGRNFYSSGIPALLRRSPNMDSLIALGTGAAVVYSIWNLLEISLGNNSVHRAHDLYFESAAMLISLISLGKYLELRSKVKTGEAIRGLMQLTPEMATRLSSNGSKEKVPVKILQMHDTVLLHPGERVALDGVVVEGVSHIDESMLTGESTPVKKETGKDVYGGTLNTTGTLSYTVTKIGSDTVLARIVSLVREAQGTKAPIAHLADRISLYFVPLVIGISLCAGLAWYFIGGADFSFSLRISIAVLVIACPCAMGLATPTSIMVGTGRGAQLGVLVKNGEVFERALGVDCAVFDKTGTLTRGKPELAEIISFTQYSETDLLQLAAAVESRSEHPLAVAVLSAAEKSAAGNLELTNFEAVPGKGVKADLIGTADKELLLGNKALMDQFGVQSFPSSYHTAMERFTDEGQTVLHLALNGKLLGLLAVADAIKEEASEVVAQLKKTGMKVVMLTGDSREAAEKIAARVGIDEVVAGVLPDGKADEIIKLQQQGGRVAMVGDGINDAPALALADVGMAMGTGIDVAMESADIVLMSGNLQGVTQGLGLSRATMTNIKQNLFWAFIYNIVGIPVAAGVLILFGGPSLNPMLGGAAMALSSVSVVSNALRLRLYSGEG